MYGIDHLNSGVPKILGEAATAICVCSAMSSPTTAKFHGMNDAGQRLELLVTPLYFEAPASSFQAGQLTTLDAGNPFFFLCPPKRRYNPPDRPGIFS